MRKLLAIGALAAASLFPIAQPALAQYHHYHGSYYYHGHRNYSYWHRGYGYHHHPYYWRYR